MTRIAFAVLAAAIGAAPAFAAQKQEVPPGPTLSGAWVLNREASSPTPNGIGPDGQGRGGYGHPPGGGAGRRGGFGGMGGGIGGMRGGPGGSGGERPDREEMERMRELAHDMIEAQTRLVIDQDGPLVTITDASGSVRRYTVNGKAEKHQLTSGTIETKAKWEDAALVIEMKGPRGMKVTRHFALGGSGDTRQLVITTEVEGGAGSGGGQKRPPIRAVYEPAIQESQG